MSHEALKNKIIELHDKSKTLESASEKVGALSAAIEIANEIVKILDPSTSGLKHGEDALEEIISTNSFRNTKVAEWFAFHPIYPDERLALKLFESDICEMKFYWLNDNSTKARISAGVMLTPNWEDGDTTANDNYKVGVDFFLKKDAKSLLMVVSERGNLRVMEFSERLTHTQEEILDKIAGSLAISSRKALHTVLWDSMALSEVNKKFYEGIARDFTILYQHLIKCGKNHDDAKLFASRLLGRLLFIWFLRKKGVIFNDEYYFPQDIKDSTKYYNSILKPLFFQTLNTPVYARKNSDLNTPYLNGGLFDAHNNDWQFEETSFPATYFTDLFNHLNKYNFTTDESSPDYEQVAIDPEMLGRVFESLLAEQRTDTGEQARKAKGAFYTPREIVSYMCKESLRQYLYNELGDEKYNSGVDKLLDLPDYEWEIAHSNAKRDLWPFENMTKFIPRVIGILDSLTVLDPACGSGAFPMGMLQLLTKTYERLDSRFDLYKTKMNIIQNTIFGVDIEPMAVEISRLRAWLAIIVDDKGEIDPLPNLDFKFVCADSLIPLERSVGLWSDPTLQEKMANIRKKFFNARKPETKEKRKNEYYKLTSRQPSILDKRENQLKSFDPFKNQHPSEFFDSEYMFGVNKFDIVIGNPPYVHLEKMKDVANVKYKPLNFKTYEARGDLYGLFFERFIGSLKDNGILTFITSNKWMRAGYGESLRDYFVNNTQPVLLVDLGSGVFESATVDTDILILKKKSYTEPTDAVIITQKAYRKELSDFIKQNAIKNTFKVGDSWAILSEIERSIKTKIEMVGTPLRDWGIKINYGIKTGCNEAFIIDDSKRNEILSKCASEDEKIRTDKIIRPILRGRDINRDGYKWAGLYCILAYFDFHKEISLYPSIYEYLKQYESKLRNRGQVRYTSSGKPKKGADYPGQHHWLELDNNPRKEYMDDFSKQKIIYSETNSSLATKITLDKSEFFTDKTCFIITGKDDEVAGLFKVMSSTIFTWYMNLLSPKLGESGISLTKDTVELFPATPNIDDYELTDDEINFISSSLSPISK